MNELDLLRDWRVPEPPAADVRDRALADLDALFYAPTMPVPVPAPLRPAGRRLLLRAAIALAVTVALTAGVVVWAQRETDRRLDAVGRIHLPEGTLSGAPGGKLPATFLIVGSDSRAGITDPAFGDPAQQTGERADTMILLRVTKDGARALWVPRDIFINGATPPKINSLLEQGAAAQIHGIETLLAVSIDHYVRVRFIGFERIVDALGGVRIPIPYPARDVRSGLDVPVPGCTTFDGPRALAWVRSRSLQYYFGAAWRSPDPVPDIGRIGRQAQLLRVIATKGRSTLRAHPAALVRLTDTALRYVQVDSGLGRDGVIAVSRALLGLSPGSLDTATVPWKTVGLPPGGEQGLALDTGASFSPSGYLLHGSGASTPGSSPTTCK